MQTESEGTELGANNTKYDQNVMSNYKMMVDLTDPLIKRSYEGYYWFYIVCKPFDVPYKKYPEWYTSFKFIKSVYLSLLKNYATFSADYFIVKERESIKEHVNVLIVSPKDLSYLDGKCTNKYRMSCQKLEDYGDRERVRDYMIKESKIRYLKEQKDYSISYKGGGVKTGALDASVLYGDTANTPNILSL